MIVSERSHVIWLSHINTRGLIKNCWESIFKKTKQQTITKYTLISYNAITSHIPIDFHFPLSDARDASLNAHRSLPHTPPKTQLSSSRPWLMMHLPPCRGEPAELLEEPSTPTLSKTAQIFDSEGRSFNFKCSICMRRPLNAPNRPFPLKLPALQPKYCFESLNYAYYGKIFQKFSTAHRK